METNEPTTGDEQEQGGFAPFESENDEATEEVEDEQDEEKDTPEDESIEE